ncbi:phytanoyl-CoA dioxygenase family protein [Roseovarius sp.]|uniref:phytanoyl-CoA dioxygenase family protein n=1 Tax=Roseovarius sp. TaxID=1486281 RepID=UPI00356887A9
MNAQSGAIERKILESAAIENWRRSGFHLPVRVMSEEKAAEYVHRMQNCEASRGPIEGNDRHKTHLLYTWANEIVREEKILDAVEDLIGPNILCWTTNLFVKEAGSPAFVSWHQDSTYWGLYPDDVVVTAWVALTPATVESGAMRYVPGSHLSDQIVHEDTYDANNLLSRGQVAKVDIDDDQTVDVVLEPGEISLHHIRMLHDSGPNQADFRRIGLAIRYIPAYVKQTKIEHDSAMLVRGKDDYGHFHLESPPVADADEAAIAQHADAMARQVATYYQGTDKTEMRA